MRTVKLRLRPEAKQGAISAFAQWIRETGQKPDRDGGHWPGSWSTLLVTGVLNIFLNANIN